MLKPKNVLITGANRGLGLELVKQFLKLPAPPKTLLATCRDPSEAKDLSEVASNHSNVKVLKLDVSDSQAVAGIAKLVEPYLEGDGLNLLINNAGVNLRHGLDTANSENMMTSFAIHVLGPLNLVQTLLPYLKQAAQSSSDKSLSCNRAAVMNLSTILSSIAGNSGGGLYPYRTSKAALNMLTKNLNVDLKPDGILCFCVHPGWVQTSMGGAQAPLDTESSISGLLNVMSKMNADSDVFVDYTGKTVPW